MFGAIYPQSEEVIVFWWPDGAINGRFRGLVVGRYGQSYRGASLHQLAYQGEPLCEPEILDWSSATETPIALGTCLSI
jgi:hypothetical protein